MFQGKWLTKQLFFGIIGLVKSNNPVQDLKLTTLTVFE